MKQGRLKRWLLLGMAGGMLCLPVSAQQSFRVMEYNVENLFDCRHDSLKHDEEFLPESAKGWNQARFQDKVKKIAQVILSAGGEQAPDLVGLCEVENEYCIQSLTLHSPLREAGYKYAMTDSPDERGIDVALLYQPSTFRPIGTQCVRIPSGQLNRRPTRDILHVSGRVATGDTLDVFVCHAPSRSGGEAKSEPYRLLTASVLRHTADSVMQRRKRPNVIIMGDFNDYPSNRSIASVLGAVRPGKKVKKRTLYNLMDGKPGGTYRYRGEWGILDQMIVNGFLLKGNKRIRTSYGKAQILTFPYLFEKDDRYGGNTPSRTYKGTRYNGGYSDHLPVSLELEMK